MLGRRRTRSASSTAFACWPTTPLRIDQTAPRLIDITARNRSRMPFQGDNKRFTTISPNGDRLRESAKIGFTLERAGSACTSR